MIILEIFSNLNNSMMGQKQPKVCHLEATKPGLSRRPLAIARTGKDRKASFFIRLDSDTWWTWNK